MHDQAVFVNESESYEGLGEGGAPVSEQVFAGLGLESSDVGREVAAEDACVVPAGRRRGCGFERQAAGPGEDDLRDSIHGRSERVGQPPAPIDPRQGDRESRKPGITFNVP